MAGNRRKSTSAKKKKAGRRNVQETNNNVPTNTNPPDINDVLSQADAALESVENALQLYSYAAGVLRNFFQALSSNMASSNEEKESSALLLSSVLGKMAEAKVSMGDQESAQQDFLEATKLLLEVCTYLHDILDIDFTEPNNAGNTPLSHAVAYGRTDVVKWL